ncbi:MAG: hypothetical protein J5914_01035 [Prevotella sp.]|nr:hypothetical protein [Prevotella sp.]
MRKLLILTAMLALVGMTMTSCGDDDTIAAGSGSGGGTTPNISNGYEYVDLGLSVKWATCNVGASQPYEYGDYFAWGETEAKSDYTWSTYKYGTSSTSLTKYCTSSSYGTVDNKTTLEAADDAATANMGGKWRMPTKAEQDELRTQCTWTWQAKGNTEFNGVAGYKVTGTNGKSIFLPAAGYRFGAPLSEAGWCGFCLSASLSESSPRLAYEVSFTSNYVGESNNYRYYGFPVRAVLPE